MNELSDYQLERFTAGKEQIRPTLDAWKETAISVKNTSENVNKRVDQISKTLDLK